MPSIFRFFFCFTYLFVLEQVVRVTSARCYLCETKVGFLVHSRNRNEQLLTGTDIRVDGGFWRRRSELIAVEWSSVPIPIGGGLAHPSSSSCQ